MHIAKKKDTQFEYPFIYFYSAAGTAGGAVSAGAGAAGGASAGGAGVSTGIIGAASGV